MWQTRKPLDLKKFTNLLNNYPNVIRTKGYVWFDNQPDSAYLFEQAGKLTSLQEDSLWIASAPKQDQMDLLKANPQLAQSWDEEYGDRINQLVFIGKNMNEEQSSMTVLHRRRNSPIFLLTLKSFDPKFFQLQNTIDSLTKPP